MALFENFPYTNLHELNLDWIVQQLNMIKESVVISVNGQTGDVILYQNATVQFPNVQESDWSIIRMADGTTRGILFKDDNTAYIVHGNQLSQIYSDDNPPAYPVTSVNGKTGAVVLYDEQYVMLPTLTDAQMNNWTFFRTLNSVARGIQFDDDGSAYIIDGTSRYMLYSTNNVPPYPVTSVNGQTGTIILFTDNNGDVRFPDFTNPNYEGWAVERVVNGTMIGLVFADDGTITLKVGLNEYKVYTENDPQEGFVTDPTSEVMQVTENSTDSYWGLLRTTTEGEIGLIFSNADPDNPEIFVAYTDSNDQNQTVQLLTTNDIPAGAGVITVNGKYGVVTLYGSEIEMATTDSRSIPDAIDDCSGLVGMVQNGTIATENISVGKYVVWNGELYICSNTIVTGDTLSLSNLTRVYTPTADMIKSIQDQISVLTFKNEGTATPGTPVVLTCPNGYKGLILTIGSTTDITGMYLVFTSLAGSVSVYNVKNASDVTITTATNSLTITPVNGTYVFTLSFT